MTDQRRLAGARFLRSFEGLEPPAHILDAVREGRTSGFTFFRALNVGSPADVRALCAALQAARPAGDPPLIIAFDQEGGQLQTVGEGATPWPGNLALGAAGSEDLARRAGRALGLEVAALGGTLNFAPVCDLVGPASAMHLGTRPFGDDPARVAPLVAAIVGGMAETGIATTLKHFPGAGRASGDPHEAMPVLEQTLDELRAADLPPFRSGIEAGAAAVMPGHLGVPAVTGRRDEPATVARAVLRDLLRDELGFEGLVISDAMNMGGAAAAGALNDAAIAACAAGIDLLLMLHRNEIEDEVFEALAAAIAAGRLAPAETAVAHERIMAARAVLERIDQPPLDVVGCSEHLALAREIAEASLTLVRDPGILPLASDAGRVALVAPVPADLTPAETSSYLRLGLAEALRARGLAVDEFVMPRDPTPAEIAALAYAVERHDVRIVATDGATHFAGQAALLRRVAALPVGRTVAVALRSPYDAALAPGSVAAVCTYGMQRPQMEALADGLLGCIPFRGTLPVRLEGTS